MDIYKQLRKLSFRPDAFIYGEIHKVDEWSGGDEEEIQCPKCKKL